MKIQYIGTGAAEGYPGMFCRCAGCEKARKAGGRNLKTRSCTLLNDHIMVDLSPDLYTQAQKLKLDLPSVTDFVITHTHADHLDRFFLMLRARDMAAILPDMPEEENYVSVYGSEFVGEAVKKAYEEEPAANPERIHYIPVECGQWFRAGGLSFYPLRANHKPGELCFIYAITDGIHSVLYANDTGRLPEETIAQIGSLGIVFDAVSMDCARGTLPGDHHMGVAENRELKKQLEDMGCTAPHTRWLLNHLSHMSRITHDELQALMEPEGFQVAYDGLTIYL